ncbi:MAG TPA: cation:proton antiporter [Bacteroidota bacterium]|nr:cation:proton antiporter [Bacteroidota bacterium]
MSNRRTALVLLVAVLLVTALAFAQHDSTGPGGSDAGGHSDPVTPVLLGLTIILAAAKLGGELFERIGQPSVLGELLAGVVLGNLVLLSPSWTFFEPLRVEDITLHWAVVVDAIARVGVILLLFEVGLESTVGEMRKVGLSSFLVASLGVVAPFFLGYAVSFWFITEVPPSILAMSPNFTISNIHLFIGAILCATSVGITARVLKDLEKIQMPESKIILGAAVIDDVLGLLILAIVGGIVVAAETGGSVSIGEIVRITGIALGFLVGSFIVGVTLIPRTLRFMSRLRTRGMMIISAVLFCFLFSYLANIAGLAAIVGAFAAGLVLEEVHFTEFREKRTLHELLHPVTTLFVPIFFVLMGIQVRLESFVQPSVLGVAGGLTLAAFIGKQVCAFGVVEKGLDRTMVGLGMVPRGEVGLIMAGIGKQLGVVDDAIFSAVVIMVIMTTIVTPPLLKVRIGMTERRKAKAGVPS